MFKNVINNKKIINISIIIILAIAVSMLSFYLVSTNERYYKKTIAKITSVTENNTNNSQNDSAKIYKQRLKAVVMNGIYKGKEIKLDNTVPFSQVYNFKFKINDEVFVVLNVNEKNEIISSSITEIKRDKYILYVLIVFVALILLIGKGKGLENVSNFVYIMIKCLLLGKNYK